MNTNDLFNGLPSFMTNNTYNPHVAGTDWTVLTPGTAANPDGEFQNVPWSDTNPLNIFQLAQGGGNYENTATTDPDVIAHKERQMQTAKNQSIIKLVAMLGGGAALSGLGGAPSAGGVGATEVTPDLGTFLAGGGQAAGGGIAGGGNALGAGGLFGAGGAPSTLAGLGGGGLSSLNAGLAGAVNAGTAGLSAGMGAGIAGGAGGIFGALGGGGDALSTGLAGAVNSGTAGLSSGMTAGLGAGGAALPSVMGGPGTVPAAQSGGGVLASNLVGGATPAATGDANWWQQILGGLGGGKDAGLPQNILAGLQGAGLLSSLFGNGNGLSDLLGLTGADAAKFRGVNTAGPGGAASTYDPNTNTVTGTGGNLDPVQAAFAKFSGDQLGQTDTSAQSAKVLDLLRKQAAPGEQRAWNSTNDALFSRGRLGANDSATGEAYRGYNEGLGQADTMRQLAALGYGQQETQNIFNRATGAATTAGQLQYNPLRGTMASINPQEPSSNPQMDLLYQLFQGLGKKP